MRLFISVDMPSEVCQVVAEVQHYLKRCNLFDGSYADSANAHLTVVFLGNVKEEVAIQIEAALYTVDPPSYSARLGSLGYFERDNQVKVIFINLICPELTGFAERVHTVLAPFYESDPIPFHSHITVARVKHVSNHEQLKRELIAYVLPSIKFEVDCFTLKESVLQSEGPMHTVRVSYPCIGVHNRKG